MDHRTLQRALQARGHYDGAIDGILGPKSRAGINALIAANIGAIPVYSVQWSAERRLVAAQQIIVGEDGFDPGPVDGLMGPRTAAALEAWAAEPAGEIARSAAPLRAQRPLGRVTPSPSPHAKPHVHRTELSPHHSSRGGRDIDHIVIHYTTSRNIGGVIEHFLTGTPRVSAHYIVGQDGELVQVVEDDKAAWHAGSSDMNARSIGIEHVARAGDRITPAQEATSAALIRWLTAEYSIPHAQIIPHVAVKSTSCPGDLFADWGGKAGADKAVQGAALAKWLEARVFLPEMTA